MSGRVIIKNVSSNEAKKNAVVSEAKPTIVTRSCTEIKLF